MCAHSYVMPQPRPPPPPSLTSYHIRKKALHTVVHHATYLKTGDNTGTTTLLRNPPQPALSPSDHAIFQPSSKAKMLRMYVAKIFCACVNLRIKMPKTLYIIQEKSCCKILKFMNHAWVGRQAVIHFFPKQNGRSLMRRAPVAQTYVSINDRERTKTLK